MEVNGKKEEEIKPYSLFNNPCSLFHKLVQTLLNCLGLESSPSPSSSSSTTSTSTSTSTEEADPRTEIVEETGFMAMITRLVRRRPKEPISSGRPGQTG